MEEEFQEALTSLHNVGDWQGSSSCSSSFDDWHYSSFQQTLLQETSIVGFVMANIIVSRRYGIVFFNYRESVLLVFEPRKLDDRSSAIKVLNADYLELGYLDRSVATVLSPLVENKMINVKVMVPGSRTSSNMLVPCQVSISAKLDDFETVKTAISQGGLILVSQPGSSFASFHDEAMVVKEKSSTAGHRNVNEKLRLVEGNENKRGRKRFSNYEPLCLHTQEPEIIENESGVCLSEHTFEIELANINAKPALQVEPEHLNFIPIGAVGHNKVSVEGACSNGIIPVIVFRNVKGTGLTECLASDPLFSSFEDFEGANYPTNYWSETFPKMLLQANEIRRTPLKILCTVRISIADAAKMVHVVKTDAVERKHFR
ncbi:unnamed protein product [Dovyalis caffra]|uniref:HIRAN domain-containing protein n=1 Tax=Dovyalis caffra TaxID=77055 RepID=A0AAV1RVR5_9ROSI|nr:unnamed protein product [Dovyalis caffra]